MAGTTPFSPNDDDHRDGQAPGPIIRDRRRLDPETGQVRASTAPAKGPVPDDSYRAPTAEWFGDPVATAGSAPSQFGAEAAADHEATERVIGERDAAQAKADEHLADLQRLQAEFVNYRRRVERDRDVAREVAVASMLEALIPVLDDVHLARQHGDLDGGPFVAITDKLDAVLARFGLARYGEPGETFDPKIHDALLHTEVELAAGTTEPTVVQILQPGYRIGDRVLRAARVAVADPQ